MSKGLPFDLDDFTSASLLAAMISSPSAFQPSPVRQPFAPRASVFLRYEGEEAQGGSCLPMLQATALRLYLAAQIDDYAREVFATVEAGFTGLSIDSAFAPRWLERPMEVVDDETDSLYLRTSDDAIIEAVYVAWASFVPSAALAEQ